MLLTGLPAQAADKAEPFHFSVENFQRKPYEFLGSIVDTLDFLILFLKHTKLRALLYDTRSLIVSLLLLHPLDLLSVSVGRKGPDHEVSAVKWMDLGEVEGHVQHHDSWESEVFVDWRAPFFVGWFFVYGSFFV